MRYLLGWAGFVAEAHRFRGELTVHAPGLFSLERIAPQQPCVLLLGKDQSITRVRPGIAYALADYKAVAVVPERRAGLFLGVARMSTPEFTEKAEELGGFAAL